VQAHHHQHHHHHHAVQGGDDSSSPGSVLPGGIDGDTDSADPSGGSTVSFKA
jgi:hypothetical protein